jgi:adenylate kinase family enzyme
MIRPMNEPPSGTAPSVSTPRRIVVKGTSGAGKTTFAVEAAERLGLTFVELDAIHHGPNWSAPTAEEFQSRVRRAMAEASDGWVIDGNYDSKLGHLVVDEADAIVWLDLPLLIKVGRVCRRSIPRIRNRVELWNGNRETWRGVFFERDSVVIWMIRAHFRHRREWPARFGHDPRFVWLRSEAAVRRWLDDQTAASDRAA